MSDSNEEEELFKSILGNPSAFIVDQQKDAPELSDEQRHKILADLYQSKKLIFLVRYNKFLSKEQLEFIRNSSLMDEEVLYFLDKLIPNKNINQIKQRRFTALQNLIADGDYFNDNNMRERNPYLYEQMIGRYLSNQERSKIEDQDRDFCDVQRPLSTFLLRQMDKNRREESRIEQKYMDGGQYDDHSNDNGFLDRIQKYNRQEDGEEEEEEEEEEDEEDEDEDENEKEKANKAENISKLEAIRAADQEHKQYLRKEFTNIMYENFLAGRDASFDYKTVDNDDKYDPINLIDRDAEESYFDSEEPD